MKILKDLATITGYSILLLAILWIFVTFWWILILLIPLYLFGNNRERKEKLIASEKAKRKADREASRKSKRKEK